MSSILNRLREVEGAALPEPSRAARRQGARRGDSPRDREEGGRKAARKAATFRVLAGVLAVFAVFLLWRAWKGESPEGKTLARSPKRAEATQKEPVESRPPATVGGEQRPVAPPASEGSASHSPGTPFAAANSGSVEVTGPGETPPLEIEGTSPSGLPPEENAVSLSSRAAPAANLLTPEEDDRTKRILRDLKVTGVYRDASGYLAFIDGRELQKGDKIGHVEIAEIASERITFTYKGKRYIMRLR